MSEAMLWLPVTRGVQGQPALASDSVGDVGLHWTKRAVVFWEGQWGIGQSEVRTGPREHGNRCSRTLFQTFLLLSTEILALPSQPVPTISHRDPSTVVGRWPSGRGLRPWVTAPVAWRGSSLLPSLSRSSRDCGKLAPTCVPKAKTGGIEVISIYPSLSWG